MTERIKPTNIKRKEERSHQTNKCYNQYTARRKKKENKQTCKYQRKLTQRGRNIADDEYQHKLTNKQETNKKAKEGR